MATAQTSQFTNQCGVGYCLWFTTPVAVERCRKAQGRDWDGKCNWRLMRHWREVEDGIVYFCCCDYPCAHDLKGLPEWLGGCRTMERLQSGGALV